MARVWTSLISVTLMSIMLLLLSRFSSVWLCATQWTAAHQAPPSLGFSRQEHWSGLPLPSPVHESEKSKWSRLVVSDSSWPHGLQPTRLLRPWDFPGKNTGVGCHCLLRMSIIVRHNKDLLKEGRKERKKKLIVLQSLCRLLLRIHEENLLPCSCFLECLDVPGPA